MHTVYPDYILCTLLVFIRLFDQFLIALVMAEQLGLPNDGAVVDDGLNLETPYEAVFALGDPLPTNRVSSVGKSGIADPDEVDEQEGGGGLVVAVDMALESAFG